MKLFLENNADVHAKNESGETALILAASNGYIEIVKLLLKKGARISDVSKSFDV